MRIAIIRLSALGDVVIASSMLAGLKLSGDHLIEWFVDERFEGIIDHSPCLSKIHDLPFKKLLKSIGGILEIRQYCRNCGDYDMVIDMQGLIKSALVGKFLTTQKFIGFAKEGAREKIASYFYTHKIHIPYDANILERNFQVLFNYLIDSHSSIDKAKILNIRKQSFGINYHVLNDTILQAMPQQSNDENDEVRIYKFLFILEASLKEKMYPIEKFSLLAHYLHSFLPDSEFYLIWHDNEENANKLLALLKKQSIFAHKLPKVDFNAIKFFMAQMDCVIGGDTGLTHLAWAMNVNCITLYGNADTTSGKNMRNTKLERVLLGNPYVVSKSKKFEIASIEPLEIFDVFKQKIYESLQKDS